MQHLKYYASIITMLMLLLQITFTSCGEGEEDGLITNGGNTTCLVSVKYSEGGTATTSDAQVMPGWEVTLTATPDEEYRFVNWTVNGVEVSKENPYTLAITTSTQFKANFEKDTYKVTVTAGEGGSVKSTSEGELLKGTKVTLTATPDEGYRFVNWTVNGVEVSTQNPYTTKITEDVEYKANFIDKYNGHGYVDLGLSVKWATCNVGATTPEEYGDYFAWGETTPKNYYGWDSYKYCNGTYNSMSKYCTSSYHGTVDNKTTLELSDDVAHVNWGSSWRMPTRAEQDELRDTNNCTWTWITQNGVNGYKVTSKKNGNSIFLPAAGYRNSSNLNDAGSYGYYWSSSLNTSLSYSAYYLYFNSSDVDWSSFDRFNGYSVRPVCE